MRQKLRWLIAAGLLFAGSLPAAATGLTSTILLEFSPDSVEQDSLQMQNWRLLAALAGDDLQLSYQHVSLQRSLELVQRSGYCSLNKLLNAERQQQMLFSQKPLNVSPPMRLIRRPQPGAVRELDLAGLLQHQPKLKIGIAAGRRYGSELDALIHTRPNNFYALAGTDSNLKLWQMLQKGRVDALIEFSARIEFIRHQLRQPTSSYQAWPILGQSRYAAGYIVCSKSAQGQQFIRYIDQLMATQQAQQAIVDQHQRYFPAAEWQYLRPYLQQLFPAAQPR